MVITMSNSSKGLVRFLSWNVCGFNSPLKRGESCCCHRSTSHVSHTSHLDPFTVTWFLITDTWFHLPALYQTTHLSPSSTGLKVVYLTSSATLFWDLLDALSFSCQRHLPNRETDKNCWFLSFMSFGTNWVWTYHSTFLFSLVLIKKLLFVHPVFASLYPVVTVAHLKTFKADIHFLQETHLKKNAQRCLRPACASQVYQPNFTAKARGVTILIRKNFLFIHKLFQIKLSIKR